jgi:hypothetical protein
LPPVPTPQPVTAVSTTSVRLYAFDLGTYVARLDEAGVQKYSEQPDPCWLYVALPSGYGHFAYFSSDVPEAPEYASLYPDPYLGTLFTAASGRRAVFRSMGEKSLDGLFEAFTQGGDWSICVTNYVEFEPHPNQHVVDRRCVEERLRPPLPWEKDLLQPLLTPTTPQTVLRSPRLLKPASLGLMEYRDGAVGPNADSAVSRRDADLGPQMPKSIAFKPPS